MLGERRDARPCCHYQCGRARSGLVCFLGIERGSVVEEFCEFVLSRGFGIENEDGVGVERDFHFRALAGSSGSSGSSGGGFGGISGALRFEEFEIQ